jgi:hypothetical protein
MPRHIKSVSLLLLAIPLMALLVESAGAEVRVAGDPKAVQVDARDASVEEVLAALGTSFGLQYRGASALERRITGTYRGSLQHVVRRLLDGYDFIMKTNVDEIEVMVLSGAKTGETHAAGPAPVAVPALTPTPTKTQTVKQRREQRRRQ